MFDILPLFLPLLLPSTIYRCFLRFSVLPFSLGLEQNRCLLQIACRGITCFCLLPACLGHCCLRLGISADAVHRHHHHLYLLGHRLPAWIPAGPGSTWAASAKYSGYVPGLGAFWRLFILFIPHPFLHLPVQESAILNATGGHTPRFRLPTSGRRKFPDWEYHRSDCANSPFSEHRLTSGRCHA